MLTASPLVPLPRRRGRICNVTMGSTSIAFSSDCRRWDGENADGIMNGSGNEIAFASKPLRHGRVEPTQPSNDSGPGSMFNDSPRDSTWISTSSLVPSKGAVMSGDPPAHKANESFLCLTGSPTMGLVLYIPPFDRLMRRAGNPSNSSWQCLGSSSDSASNAVAKSSIRTSGGAKLSEVRSTSCLG